jgi:hypothetical protein
MRDRPIKHGAATSIRRHGQFGEKKRDLTNYQRLL